jgi:hypothetical protein
LTARPAASRLIDVDRPQTIIATRSRTVALAALALLLLGARCTSGIDLLGDGDHDVVPPADADGGADADAEADVAVEADAEAEIDIGADADDGDADVDDGDADVGTCAGGWFDPVTGLCWEEPPDATMRSWDEAVAYCDALALGGFTDWQMPTIGQLRSLIRGCPATETDGSCSVTDFCFDADCWNDTCDGCVVFSGPGPSGCYWDPVVTGPCEWCWSSSPYVGAPSYVWGVYFYGGNVNHNNAEGTGYARCVRPGP